MTKLNIIDTVEIRDTRVNAGGYLVTDARVARTGVQSYLGSEVGKPEMPLVRVYRPGTEVFSDETLESVAHKPVTNNHPPELVTADNWKQYAVGHTADEIIGEGKFIRVPMMVSDGAAVQDIKNGKRELSAGYTCELDFVSGVTQDGEKYDAIQKNIRFNHVAIVERGRAGSEVRIGDAAAWGISPIMDSKPEEVKPMAKTVTVKGIPVEVTDQAAAAVDTILRDLAIAETKIATMTSDHQKELAAKDALLATKDAEIDGLKKNVLSDADLQAKITARSGLIADAQLLAADVDYTKLDEVGIRTAALTKLLGDGSMAGKSADYVNVRFDIAVEDAKKSGKTPENSAGVDPFRTIAKDGLKPTEIADTSDKAWGGMVQGLQDAWKTPLGMSKGA